MNERIRLLAKKASIKITPMILDGVEYEYEDVDMDGFEDLQKFSELIIEEAISALWTEECYTSDLAIEEYRRAIEEYRRNSDKIKQHFGL